MLRNYGLRLILLVMLLVPMPATPVLGAPGPFGKITPPNGATGQPLFPTLSWQDSAGAVGYEYCYDMVNDGVCAGDRWIPSGTVALPPNDLVNNTTYYWQVRAIDAEGGITYADGGVWWSFKTQNPALTVDKTLTNQSTTPIVPGTVLTYTITATNTGDVTLSNVVVSDTLLTPTGGTTPCATLPEGASCTLVGRYTVTQGDVDAGQIVNTGRAVSHETPVAVTDTLTTPIPQQPALTVDKALTAQSATPIALGTLLTYTITATNAGNVTLFNGVVSDTVITPASEHCGILTLGATCVLTGSYVVRESDFMAGGIVNRATAIANAPNGSPLAPVTDTVTTPLVAAPPVANPDPSLGNPIGQAVTVDVLANDVRGDLPISPTTVMIVNPPPGSTLSPDGKMLVVFTEGVWLVNPTTGAITFTPLPGFSGDPTPISYTVDDVLGNTSNAATVTVTYTLRPVANDDASLGNAVGSAVTVDVLANDQAAPGRTLEPASVRIVGADAGSDGKRLTVVGEGVWTVDPNTGVITFTPAVTFEGNPTPIAYLVDDDQGNTSNPAAVTVTYTDTPLARNDVSLGNPVGRAVTVDVLANDVAAPGRTLKPASVQITGTAQAGASLVVPGEGTWSVYTVTGAITFTPEANLHGNPTPIIYTVADDQGNVSNPAMVTVTYTEPPIAVDDVSLGNPVGRAVTVDVLANDSAAAGRTLDPASVQIMGTVNPGESLNVAGQGTWSVSIITGAITFTPEESLIGDPTPITYTVADDQGNTSNVATVMVTYAAQIDEGFAVYLPLVLHIWPPIPGVPVLNVINNPNGYGEYTLSWSSTERATSYLLQEAKDSSFSDAVEVYSDTNTSTILTDKGPTRYYYRVQARNAYGASGWSNVQMVDVLWEKEPNDAAIPQANGPLVSGLTYYGRFTSGADIQDYYFISLQSAQSVELWLSNIVAGQDYDLTLRDSTLGLVGHSGELGNANEHIRTGTLPAGWYYIQVYNRSGSGSTQAYHLRGVYPAIGLTTAAGQP